MVRRRRDDAVVRRPLAQGRLRHLHGGEDAGRRSTRRARTSVEDVLPAQQAGGVRRGRRPPARRRSGSSSRISIRPRATTARSSTTRRRASSSSSTISSATRRSARACTTSSRARVRQRHVAGPARGDRRRRRIARSTTGDGSTSCAPACRCVEQQLDVARRQDRAPRARCSIRRRRCPGSGVWPMRTEVALWHSGAVAERIPVEIRAETTVVAAADGHAGAGLRVRERERLRATALVHARRAQRRSGSSAHIGDVRDAFLRAMLWGAMWDLVRDARLAPTRFIATRDARASARERRADRRRHRRTTEPRDVGVPVGRAAARRRSAEVEALLLAGASNARRAVRRAQEPSRRVHRARADAGGARATRPHARQHATAGVPLRPPTRWAIVTRCRARRAERRRAARRRGAARHDARRASAARSSPAPRAPTRRTKADYFDALLRATTTSTRTG